LTPASDRGFWHHLIGEQLIRLVQRPGSRLPADPASLDLAEEAISHALAAGRTEQGQQANANALRLARSDHPEFQKDLIAVLDGSFKGNVNYVL